MQEREIAGTSVNFDQDGHLADSKQWSEAIARELAKEVGIEDLNDSHWKVIHFMRGEYEKNGAAPTIRKIGKQSGVGTKEMYALFPKGPAKLAAKIGGLPKPKGCI